MYHDSGEEEALRRLTSLFLRDRDDGFREYPIESLRMRKLTPVFKLKGVESRSEAEALSGLEVFADEDESRPVEESAWLVSELAGMEVRMHGKDDADVFHVKSIISNPAHDILEIETGKGVKMLPFIDVFVREVDTEKGLISIIPPEGWLD